MSPMKQALALDTCASSGKAIDPKRFRDIENEKIFLELNNRILLRPWKVIAEDVKHLGIRCFDLMRNAGLSCLIDMDEFIYPTLVREFYSNLQFEEDNLKAKVYLRGKTRTLTEKMLSVILRFEDSGNSIRIFDKIKFEGYEKKRAVISLTGSKLKNAAYTNMDVESQIMFHALCHIVTPKLFKQNSVNSREVFYLWCIKNGYNLNVPFIVLSHMRAFLKGEVKDIPYAMLVTKIARYFDIGLEEEKDKMITGIRSAYHLKFLRGRMGLLKSDDAEESDEEETESEERLIDLKKRKRIEEIAAESRKKLKGKVIKASRKSLRSVKKHVVESSTRDNPVSLSDDSQSEDSDKEDSDKEEENPAKGKELMVIDVQAVEEESAEEGGSNEERIELEVSEREASEEKNKEETEDEADAEENKEEASKEKGEEGVSRDKSEEETEKEAENEESTEKDAEKEEDEEGEDSSIEEEEDKEIEEEEAEEEENKEVEKSEEAEPPMHPMDFVPTSEPLKSPQGSKGKEVVDEEEVTEDEIDPLLQALTTISDQLEVTNKRMMEQTQVIANGFQMIDKKLQQSDLRSTELVEGLRKLEESLMDKRVVDANHQEAVIELTSRIFAKMTEFSTVKSEKKKPQSSALIASQTKLTERKIESRKETSTPSQLPSVEYSPSISAKSPKPASSATPKPDP